MCCILHELLSVRQVHTTRIGSVFTTTETRSIPSIGAPPHIFPPIPTPTILPTPTVFPPPAVSTSTSVADTTAPAAEEEGGATPEHTGQCSHLWLPTHHRCSHSITVGPGNEAKHMHKQTRTVVTNYSHIDQTLYRRSSHIE